MEVYRENNLFQWVIYTMAMLNNHRVYIFSNLHDPDAEMDTTTGHGLSRDARGKNQLWLYIQKIIDVERYWITCMNLW